MTPREISAIVDTHTCTIDGTAYRFTVDWVAAEQIENSASGRVLVHVHVTAAEKNRDGPVTDLYVMAALQDPAQVLPDLLTGALHERLRKNTQ